MGLVKTQLQSVVLTTILKCLAWSPRPKLWLKGWPHLKVICCQIILQEGCTILWSHQSECEGPLSLQGVHLFHFHTQSVGDMR